MGKKRYLVIAHVAYRNNTQIRGPFSSVLNALSDKNPTFLGIPLFGFEQPITYGNLNRKQNRIEIPKQFGNISFTKYIIDFFTTFALIIKFLSTRSDDKIIIGADPLSTLPAVILKPFSNFKLVFYSVDFNESRFADPLMQKAYEFADKLSSQYANQVWVVSESLIQHKKRQ